MIALVVSARIGKKQVEISQIKADFQNKVELYLAVGLEQIQGEMVPVIYIKNAGNNIVYTKYEMNGKQFPQNKFVLPPMSTCSDACYCIHGSLCLAEYPGGDRRDQRQRSSVDPS